MGAKGAVGGGTGVDEVEGAGVAGPDRAAGRLAVRQHGVIARRQLLALGVSRRAIGGRLDRGVWHLVHRGVYAVGHRALSLEGRWMAAVLAGGPGAALSHRSAGQLWGIVPRSRRTPEITAPLRRRRRSGLAIHESPLPADEIEAVEGIPVTSVSRTLLDLAAVVNANRLERAMNEAEVLRLGSRLSLPMLLDRYPRRRGSAPLRALLRDRVPARGVTRNDFEARFRALVENHGLPLPRFNADLAVGGRFFEVDCLWDDRRLIVELDGRAVHGTARAFESDRGRDRILMTEGWRVTRVTWRQLRDEPAALALDMRRLLAPPA